MYWATSNDAARLTPVLLAAVLLIGCSDSDIGKVSGTVTLDGKPLTGAAVVFEDASRGISVNATLATDGTFTARTHDKPGLPPGTYQVAVRPAVFAGADDAPLVEEATSAAKPPPPTVPARYHSAKTSDLTATVVAGDNEPLQFDLVSTNDE